jgi:hypothetical protein
MKCADVNRVEPFGAAIWCIALSCVIAACEAAPSELMETRRAALTNPISYVQKLVVPAYFNQGTTSRTVLSGTTYGGYAIANFDSGPGASVNSTDLAWVQSIQSKGTKVLGYIDDHLVDLPGEPLRWVGDLVVEVRHWKDWYGVDGIFFDDAWRTVAEATLSDRSRMEGMQQFVSDYIGATAPIIFNWGQTDQAMEYVYCSQNVGGHPHPVFSIYEGTESAYQTASFPSWVTTYQPDTFSHLLYAADPGGANVGTDMLLGRARNAAQIYVTDGPAPAPGLHTWGALPGYNTNSTSQWWTQEVALSTSYSDYPNVTTPTTVTCPSSLLYPAWMFTTVVDAAFVL